MTRSVEQVRASRLCRCIVVGPPCTNEYEGLPLWCEFCQANHFPYLRPLESEEQLRDRLRLPHPTPNGDLHD